MTPGGGNRGSILLRQRPPFPSQGSQVPPPVGNPEWPARSVAAIRSGPTVPTPRAKGIREHRVPLCRRALEILKEARELGRGNPLVFPPVGGKPIANTATSDLLRESGIAAVPHGFRSSFRDSAAEETDHPREVIEAPVAHVVRNRVAIKGILWVMRTGLLWRGNNESLRANWGKMLQLGLGGSWRQLRGSVC